MNYSDGNGESSAANSTSLLLGSGHSQLLCPGNCSGIILNTGKAKAKIHHGMDHFYLWVQGVPALHFFSACLSSASIQLVMFKACLVNHVYFTGWGRSVGKEQHRLWSWAAPCGGGDKTLGPAPCVCLVSAAWLHPSHHRAKTQRDGKWNQLSVSCTNK